MGCRCAPFWSRRYWLLFEVAAINFVITLQINVYIYKLWLKTRQFNWFFILVQSMLLSNLFQARKIEISLIASFRTTIRKVSMAVFQWEAAALSSIASMKIYKYEMALQYYTELITWLTDAQHIQRVVVGSSVDTNQHFSPVSGRSYFSLIFMSGRFRA